MGDWRLGRTPTEQQCGRRSGSMICRAPANHGGLHTFEDNIRRTPDLQPGICGAVCRQGRSEGRVCAVQKGHAGLHRPGGNGAGWTDSENETVTAQERLCQYQEAWAGHRPCTLVAGHTGHCVYQSDLEDPPEAPPRCPKVQTQGRRCQLAEGHPNLCSPGLPRMQSHSRPSTSWEDALDLFLGHFRSLMLEWHRLDQEPGAFACPANLGDGRTCARPVGHLAAHSWRPVRERHE